MSKFQFFMSGFLILFQVFFSKGLYAKNLSPSSYDRDVLEISKRRIDFGLNRKTWQLGVQAKVVKSPGHLLRSLEGIYYSGHLLVRRFGTDLDLPLAKYKWNPDKGNRWVVFEQFIFWDKDENSWSMGWSGMKTHDYNEYTHFTEVELGDLIDMAPFDRIYKNRKNLIQCSTGGWAVTKEECDLAIDE
jgi:hypothetical protein